MKQEPKNQLPRQKHSFHFIRLFIIFHPIRSQILFLAILLVTKQEGGENDILVFLLMHAFPLFLAQSRCFTRQRLS